MIRKFLKSRANAARPPVSIPAGQRVYAIGDVHGCDELLERLLTLIDEDDRTRDAAETTLLFLGDLVDRGPASASVVARLRRLKDARPTTRFLMGNHEEIFLGAIEGEPKALRMFCRIGGRETAVSYGIDPVAYDRMDYEEFRCALAAAVPEDHVQFIASFEDMITIGDYAFVHAGVRPGTALEDQHRRDLRWIRDPFLDHDIALAKMVIHGHTMSHEVEMRPHRIGVDTGAYASGRLTALGIEGDQRWTIDTA